jgi:hypothetical protein
MDRTCGICGGRNGTGTGFLRVLRFPLQILIPPTAPRSSSSVSRGWYSRLISGRHTKWTQSHPTPKNLKKKELITWLLALRYALVPDHLSRRFVQQIRSCADFRFHIIYLASLISFFLSPLAPTLEHRTDFSFHDHFTDGRTPWTGDQLVPMPLPKHRTTQTQNKHIHQTSMPCVGFEPTIPVSSERRQYIGDWVDPRAGGLNDLEKGKFLTLRTPQLSSP